jgi:hypothetical protein
MVVALHVCQKLTDHLCRVRRGLCSVRVRRDGRPNILAASLSDAIAGFFTLNFLAIRR